MVCEYGGQLDVEYTLYICYKKRCQNNTNKMLLVSTVFIALLISDFMVGCVIFVSYKKSDNLEDKYGGQLDVEYTLYIC